MRAVNDIDQRLALESMEQKFITREGTLSEVRYIFHKTKLLSVRVPCPSSISKNLN